MRVDNLLLTLAIDIANTEPPAAYQVRLRAIDVWLEETFKLLFIVKPCFFVPDILLLLSVQEQPSENLGLAPLVEASRRHQGFTRELHRVRFCKLAGWNLLTHKLWLECDSEHLLLLLEHCCILQLF